MREKRRTSPSRQSPARHSPDGSRRKLHKRKAALALSVGAMTLSIAAVDPALFGNGTSMLNPHDVRQPVSELSVSDAFKQALIGEEGLRKTVYRDGAGNPTVGVGHLVTASDGLHVGEQVSYDRILQLLDKDLLYAEGAVARLVGDLPLLQHEYDALVDLVYNVGEGNVSARRSPKLNAAIGSGDHDRIAAELAYSAAGGVEAGGLVLRSERRTQMFVDGEYVKPRLGNG